MEVLWTRKSEPNGTFECCGKVTGKNMVHNTQGIMESLVLFKEARENTIPGIGEGSTCTNQWPVVCSNKPEVRSTLALDTFTKAVCAETRQLPCFPVSEAWSAPTIWPHQETNWGSAHSTCGVGEHQMLLQRQSKRDGGGGREERAVGGEIQDLSDSLEKAFTKEAN